MFFGLRKIYITVLPVQRRFWELCLNENAKADMSATLPRGFEGRTFALKLVQFFVIIAPKIVQGKKKYWLGG